MAGTPRIGPRRPRIIFLAEWREHRKLTQKQLGERLGVPDMTISRWEKAARGALGRIYPWGDQLSCGHANWGNFGNEGPCAGKNPGETMAVGSFPSGSTPEGVMDLGGNVWEWVQDVYEADRGRRVVKGGSCCSYFVEPRAANRNAWAPDYHDADLGFRCAYN